MLEAQHLIVALAEPSPVQTQIISKALAEMGITRVSRYDSGHALLDATRQRLPDLVVSAFHLPDMTGGELLENMRSSNHLRDTPFILVSSETQRQRLESIRQHGSMAILPKPFDLAQLDRALASVLDFINAESMAAEMHDDLALLNVLIVDDSNTSRRHIRTVLEKLGFERFTEAESGPCALPHLQEEHFDLIIVDYYMPQMDGAELTRLIRQDAAQASVPVLLITSETDQERLAAVEAAGVSAICDKPFETEKIRTLIRELLQV